MRSARIGTAARAAGRVRAKAKRAEARVPEKHTEAEQDLVWHMEHGWRRETDSLGGNPVLRNLKNDETMRPASADRNTVKGLEERELIAFGTSSDPLKIAWRLNKAKE